MFCLALAISPNFIIIFECAGNCWLLFLFCFRLFLPFIPVSLCAHIFFSHFQRLQKRLRYRLSLDKSMSMCGGYLKIPSSNSVVLKTKHGNAIWVLFKVLLVNFNAAPIHLNWRQCQNAIHMYMGTVRCVHTGTHACQLMKLRCKHKSLPQSWVAILHPKEGS